MGVEGAYCFYTLSETTRVIEKEEWDRVRFGQICGESEAYANMKAAILKLCSVTQLCTYEMHEILNHFDDNIRLIREMEKERGQD